MAARRERERRRPTERRYSFTSPEPAIETDQALIESEISDGEDLEPAAVETAPARPRDGRSATAIARSPSIAASRGGTRTAPKPFSAYKEEYAYVYSDLRRVGLVVGSLLAILIILYFVLPLVVHS
jgi:hypothetical protein